MDVVPVLITVASLFAYVFGVTLITVGLHSYREDLLAGRNPGRARRFLAAAILVGLSRILIGAAIDLLVWIGPDTPWVFVLVAAGSLWLAGYFVAPSEPATGEATSGGGER